MGMSRAARRLQTPAGFDDPLDMMLGCHRRIERQVEALKALRRQVEAHGVDAEASVAAERLLAWFDRAASHHHDDEELDLFPLLAQRITDLEASNRFEAFRGTLAADHRQLDAAWARLRRPIEGIAEGLARHIDARDLEDFAGKYAAHIHTEEIALHEFFERWLDEDDRRALGHAMAQRRRESTPPRRK